MTEQSEKVRVVAADFCTEFVKNPYLCYTEHGLHALFYTKLYNALAPAERYAEWAGRRVCVIQKEYPTARSLGKSRRQNWDIAVIKTPPESLSGRQPSYDYLRLAAVVELGMNEAREHFEDDLSRLCHPGANLKNGFIIHLYRISGPGVQKVSGRDWSPSSTRILTYEQVAELVEGKAVEVLYALADNTDTHPPGAWSITDGNIQRIV
ncbi:MAG: hypothetical protein E3J21_25555 [Anaerolineales bacterium]|nr:MAG: hypothetical protein E3J21_25555 [Anaerolineales bacterium]